MKTWVYKKLIELSEDRMNDYKANEVDFGWAFLIEARTDPRLRIFETQVYESYKCFKKEGFLNIKTHNFLLFVVTNYFALRMFWSV